MARIKFIATEWLTPIQLNSEAHMFQKFVRHSSKKFDFLNGLPILELNLEPPSWGQFTRDPKNARMVLQSHGQFSSTGPDQEYLTTNALTYVMLHNAQGTEQVLCLNYRRRMQMFLPLTKLPFLIFYTLKKMTHLQN